MRQKLLALRRWLEKHCADASTPTVVNTDSTSEKPSLTTHLTEEVVVPAQINFCGIWGVIRRKMAALIKKKHVKVVEPRVNPVSYNPPEEEFTGAVSSLCRKWYAQEITEWKRLMKPHVDPITHNPPEGEFIGAVSSLCWNLYAQDFDLKWL